MHEMRSSIYLFRADVIAFTESVGETIAGINDPIEPMLNNEIPTYIIGTKRARNGM